MTSSGLQAMLETVYAENTIPYMLNGKAISQAICGHLLMFAALHTIRKFTTVQLFLKTMKEESNPGSFRH